MTASIASNQGRLKLLGAGIAVLLGTALLAACGGGGGSSGYPKAVQSSFVDGMESQGVSKKDATCVLNWFESHRSASQYNAETSPEGPQFESDSRSALEACHVAVPTSDPNSGDTSSGDSSLGNSSSDTSGSGRSARAAGKSDTTASLTAFCTDLGQFHARFDDLLSDIGSGASPSDVAQAASAMQALADEAPTSIGSQSGTVTPKQDAQAAANDLKAPVDRPNYALHWDFDQLKTDQQSCPGNNDSADQ